MTVTNFRQFADDAQQSFLSSKYPTLAYVLPALKKLFQQWTKHRQRDDYKRYYKALDAGLAVVEEYYERTEDSDTFIMGMCK